MHRIAALLLLCTAFVSAGCPKSPQVLDPLPDKPRFEPRKDAEADAALDRAALAAETLPKSKAVEGFLQIRKQFPQTTASQEALYRAGVLAYDGGDYVTARNTLNELLFENPLFDKALDAKYRLGVAAIEVGAHRDAYQTLASLSERLSGDEKRRALEQAARAAELAQLEPIALDIAIRFAREARNAEEQRAALQRVTDLVEGKVKFADLAKAQQELASGDPSWPILTFKLARIYYHLRDWANLETALDSFLRVAPDHPYGVQAREMKERAGRLGHVRPNVVGVVLPLTGKYKQLGEVVLQGINLALKGSSIELIVKDSQGDVNLAGKAVEELALDEGAIAIIGPLLSDDSRRAALVAEELQLPIVTLTRAEGITEIGQHVFRNMLTYSAQANAIGDYATRVLGFKSFAVLYPDTAYGTEMANLFWDQVLARGGTLRGAEHYDHDQTTFTNEVQKLVGRYYLDDRLDYIEKIRELSKDTKLDPFRRRKAIEKLRASLEPVVDFEAIFIPDVWQKVGLLAPALAVEDVVTNACDPKDLEKIRKTTGKKDLRTVTLLGTNEWRSPKGRDGVPELIARGQKFVMCSIYVEGFYPGSNRSATQRFVKAFQKSLKDDSREPGLLEAIGYDTAAMVRNVIDKNAPTTRAQFRQLFAGIKNFEGASGRTTINEKREADKPLFLLRIEPNGIRELNPDKPPET